MRRHFYSVAISTLIGTVVILLTGQGQAATEEDIAKAQKAVLAIADDIANKNMDAANKKIDAYLKANVNDYKDLEAPMKTMALRDNGGVGFGVKGRFKPDGIEAQLIDLNLKPPAGPALAGLARDLTKSANIIAAVSEMALKKTP